MKLGGQCDRILAVLKASEGQWVPLPRLLELQVSQYGARVHELRKRGWQIENKSEYQTDGSRHTWFRLMVTHPYKDDCRCDECSKEWVRRM